jgi:FKBP-type peptidyl-prolyl cis-trans isomerase FkpA
VRFTVHGSRFAVLALAAFCLTVSSCSQSITSPSSSFPFSQVDLLAGTGDAAAVNDILTVNYTGWLYDPTKPDNKGLQFDTTVGKDPFVFTLGTASVIQGWDQGLVGMKTGGIRRLVVPPSLGYGDVRNFSIPPYSTLVFEIELVSVTAPSS